MRRDSFLTRFPRLVVQSLLSCSGPGCCFHSLRGKTGDLRMARLGEERVHSAALDPR